MHKYFAKTLFLGKKVEFLSECHSTNRTLLERVATDDIREGFVVYTDHQISGRGQRGNVWLSEPGKNLLFSVYVEPKTLLAKQAYQLNIVSGLAVVDALKRVLQLSAELKWPNDVYLNDNKLAGILVETNLGQHGISGAVIGIGINVGQGHFPLPHATSIFIETQFEINREVLLEEVLISLERYLIMIRSNGFSKLLQAYYSVMRWRGELREFRSENSVFEGEIIGIDETGRLLVKTKDVLQRFDVKQIEFLH